MLSSIAESNKLKAIKIIKSTFENMNTEIKTNLREWPIQTDIDLPNPVGKIILPILEYFILQTSANSETKSNMGSTLALLSL